MTSDFSARATKNTRLEFLNIKLGTLDPELSIRSIQ